MVTTVIYIAILGYMKISYHVLSRTGTSVLVIHVLHKVGGTLYTNNAWKKIPEEFETDLKDGREN